MHVVVVGCGRLGAQLAKRLSADGSSVAVIDRNPAAFERLGPAFEGSTVVGIGFDRQHLTDAGIERAQAVAAVTSGDNSNIIVARLARETYGVERVVARINDPRRAEIYQRLGIVTVAPTSWASRQVLRHITGDAATEWVSPAPGVNIVERRMGREWVGHRALTIEDATTRIVAIARTGRTMLPTPDLTIQDGDLFYLAVGCRSGRGVSGRLCACRTGAVMTASEPISAVIAGGGSVGRFVAEQLAGAGHLVTLVEIDRDVVAEHRTEDGLAGVNWIVGDACDVDVLAAAGLETATVTAAVTGDDEDNLVVSLLAKQEFGMPRVVARVNNPKNEWMFGEMWGVDVALSTPHLLAGLVQDAVGVDTLVRLLPFEGGRVRIVEIVLGIASPCAGAEISSLGLPRDSSIVAIQRDGHVIVPRGETVVHAGDKIVLLVTADSEPTVASLLAPG